MRIEYFTTEKLSAEFGLDKFIAYFDKNRDLEKVECYRNGQIFSLNDDKMAKLRARIPTKIKEWLRARG